MHADGVSLLKNVGGFLTHSVIPHYELTKEEVDEVYKISDLLWELIKNAEKEGK